MSYKRLGGALALGCMLVFTSIFKASAQIPAPEINVALAQIGKMEVGDVLNQIEEMVQNIGNIVNNDLNLDFGNAFIALQAGTQGVLYSLDEERQTVVNNLDDQRKNALLDVYVLANDMLTKKIPFQQAKLKVDTLTVLNHVAILGKKTPFMITAVDPTVIAYKGSGDYNVIILGIGIGNEEGKQLPTTITLTPSDGPATTIKPDNIPDGVQFTIPRNVVVSKFGSTDFYRMTVVVASKVPERCGFLKITTCDHPYSFDYAMKLFPRIAVRGIVNQIITTPSTDPSTRKPLYFSSPKTPDANNKAAATWSTPVMSADVGYQIVRVDMQSCVNIDRAKGNPCQFVSVDPGSALPKNGGASAQVSGHGYSWPVVLNFAAWEEKQIKLSVQLPSFPEDFGAGESKTVNVTGDAASVLMNVTTATGSQSIIPLVPPGGSALDSVVCTNRTDIGGGFAQYVCKAQDISFY